MQLIESVPVLCKRKEDSHKGDYGKVVIIAGSVGMSGAAAIAGRSALRSGAGLVRLAVPRSIIGAVSSIEPCYTTIALEDDKCGMISAKAISRCFEAVEDNDVAAFGPGVGVGGGVKKVLETLIQLESARLVVDADGLNNLSKITGWADSRKARMIITPHPGEMQRLWPGVFRKVMPAERVDQALELAQKTGCVVVLKGAGTVVSDGERVYVNKTGNPGMATAGSGDVLTGVITALAGQGLGDLDSAVLGVYVHGLAGDIAAEKYGQVSMIATDIIDCLCDAFKALTIL